MGENKNTSSGADIIMKGSFSVVVKTAFATTVENTKAALKDNGFGVLTEIDFQKTFDAKLGEKILPSLQLGACNPKLAWQVYSTTKITLCCCLARSSSRLKPTGPRKSRPSSP